MLIRSHRVGHIIFSNIILNMMRECHVTIPLISILILFQILLNFLFIKKKKKNLSVSIKILSRITVNNKKAANQHVRMISEGSCDTEDWINDAKIWNGSVYGIYTSNN